MVLIEQRHPNEERALPKAVAVVGPTASGKTELVIRLAKAFRGEIVSADSRQVYRGMRIGADIPEGKWVSRKGRRRYMVQGVPHHLMSFRSPAEPMTVAEFRSAAIRKMKEIAGRGRLPILVGGTGLYVKAVIGGLAIPAVGPDASLRRRLGRLPNGRLHAMLSRRDPAYAARIPAANRRYVIRAIEVFEKTGRRFSELHEERSPQEFEVLQIGIRRPRADLYRRIEDRVDEQMAAGLAREARRLSRRYGWELSSMSGLGYRQFRDHFSGKSGLEEAVDKVKRDTRRYAKRQMTWFRHDKGIRWVKGLGEASDLIRKFLKG